MSPKELLYIEDALGHETQIKVCCADSATQVSDPELKNLISAIGQKHNECFSRFYSLLS